MHLNFVEMACGWNSFQVWDCTGKILAKVKNGRIVRVNIHTDLDEAFRRAMSGNEMSADEEE